MSGSAIYTQIRRATICILSQGLKEWICNFFSPRCLSYLGGGTCVKWQCYHGSWFLLKLVTRLLCTGAGCCIQLNLTGQGRDPNNIFFKGNVYRTHQGQNKDVPTLTTYAGLNCHHNNLLQVGFKHFVRGMLWTLGILPTIDGRQEGQSESK